jgi:RNA polymerase sigma-70 factor (ECF subfamily)
MGYADLSDEELLAEARRLRGVEREALVNELFARHYERVARWCLRFTGNRDSAADLAQDVFLKAHRHLDSFRAASRFSTWLYSIVRNESFSRLERMPPPSDSEDVLADIAAADAGPEELANRSQRGQYVRELLTATLDRLERAVFVLHYGEGMPLDAITRLLRLDNTSGAKAYIVSARRKLAKAAQRIRARGDTV